MKINFNSFSLGCCGGTRFILELSNRLVDRGHEVTITHAGLPSLHDWFSPIKAQIIECNIGLTSRVLNKYGVHKIDVHKAQEKNLVKSIPKCDVNVATYYDTAEPTVRSGKGKMIYLVQHYEPLFFERESTQYKIAEFTYFLPLKKLCVSHWLTEKVNGFYIGNGVNLDKFKRYPVAKKFDVMVIPNPNLKYKGDYAATIDLLRDWGLKVLVVKSVSESELVRAYNISETFLFLSEQEGFGYPPLEAMACGTPVISTPCTEFLVNEINCLLLPENYSPEIIGGKLNWLLDNKYHLSHLAEGGFATAKQYDFNRVVDNFEEAIQ